MSADQLLLACEPGNAGVAFAEFYCRFEAAVLAFHVRRVVDAEVAADLTAETFVQALEGRARFRADQGDAAQWLFGIARHVQARHWRTRAFETRRRDRLSLERQPLAEEQKCSIERLSLADGLADALRALPADQAAAVSGYILGDRSYDELAASFGTSAGTVRKRVSRGMRSLRNAVEGSR